MKVTLDIETFSRCDLKKAGLAAYAEHESTDILCLCWAVDDGPVSAWIPSADAGFIDELRSRGEIDGAIHCGHRVPMLLQAQLKELGGTEMKLEPVEVHAWNNAFERKNLNGTAGRRYDFPKLEIPNMRCSMAKARVHGLPGGLEDAANAVRSPVKKRLAGVNAMRYLCKPRADGSRPTIQEERERFLQLVPYCADDVRAERAVDNIVPDMSDAEQEIWQMDQEMNDHGVLIDTDLVDDMEMLIFTYKKELEQRCREWTGIKPSRPGPLAAWVREHGYPGLENLQADTVRKAVLLETVPEECKRVLKLYSTFNAKAVMKYAAMRQAVCSDNRIRSMFMYYGASTGRWSSTIVQLQNLARPSIADPESAIEAAKTWDLEWIRSLYPGVDPMKVFATCVRGALMAAPGNELVFPDFAGVEARYNAWLFDEQWKLEAFRKQDAGLGPSTYCVVYGECFGVDPNFDTKTILGAAMKQQGKVLDLSMGYEGGVGAHVKMAATYRIDLKDMADKTYPVLPSDILEEATDAWHYAIEQGRTYDLPQYIWVASEGQKRAWRRRHPGIVQGWKDLKQAAIDAVNAPGQIFRIPNGRVAFKVEGDWLLMRLPSGRKMFYYRPEVKRVKRVSGQNDTGVGGYERYDETLYYLGVNTLTRQWGRASMYGGSWCNNETQGGCRDLLVRAKLRLRVRAALIGSVHDEPMMETPVGAISDEEILADMCGNQTWDKGLPLAVEIHRGTRYRK